MKGFSAAELMAKQPKNNKSIQEECKIWVLIAEAYGYVVQFKPYQGAKKGKQVAKWKLAENVAVQLLC